MQDESLEYKNKIIQIKKQLSRIQELGIDTNKYEEILNSILSSIENDLDESNRKEIFKEAFVNKSYVDGISKLNNLMFLLEEYNTYYKAFNTSIYIDLSLEEELGPEKINKFVSEIQSTLKSLKVSNHLHFKDEKMVLEKVYDVTYKLIKRELITNGKSNLLEAIKSNEIDSSFIEELITKDIKSSNKTQELNSKLHELKSKGLESSLLNEELILLLIDKPEITDTEKISEFEQLSNNIYKNGVKIKDAKKSTKQTQEIIEMAKSNLKDRRKDLIKAKMLQMGPYVLPSLVVAGAIFGTLSKTKKDSMQDYYEVKTKTYSTYDESVKDKELTHEFKDGISNGATIVTVNKYSTWKENNGREIINYEVADIPSRNIEDYALLDETNGLIKTGSDFQNSNALKNSEVPYKNNKEVTIVNVSEYTNPVKKLNKEYYISNALIGITIELIGLAIALAMAKLIMLGTSIKEEVEFRKSEVQRCKNSLYNLYKQLEQERIKLKFLLDSNDKLKKEYIDFYNKNKILLYSEKETFNETMKILEELDKVKINENEVKIKRKVLN